MTIGKHLGALLREPLAHFALAGVAVFAADAMLRSPAPGRSETERVVVVSDGFVEALASQMPAVTDEDERIARYVREEALYREALRLGLDRGDAIVRRRLVQKMEFVLEGRVDVPEPTDRQLEAYLEAHPDRFQRPPRLSLAHVFFSRDRRGDRTRADAEAALETLQPRAGEAPVQGAPAEDGLGDPFLRGDSLESQSPADLGRIFGPGFAAEVASVPAKRWGGPVRSSYGWHLVYVREREPGGDPPLADVRAEVAREWRDQQLAAARERVIRQLVEQYDVRRVAEASK